MKLLFSVIACLFIFSLLCEAGFIGPVGDLKPCSLPNHVVDDIVLKIRDTAAREQARNQRANFTSFQAVKYSTQIYLSINYFIKIKIFETANGYAHARVRVAIKNFYNQHQDIPPVLEYFDVGYLFEEDLLYVQPSPDLVDTQQGGQVNETLSADAKTRANSAMINANGFRHHDPSSNVIYSDTIFEY